MLRHQLRRTAFSRDVKAILAWTRTRESARVRRMRRNYAGHPGRRRLLTGLHPGGDGQPRFGLIAAGSVVAVAAQQRQHLLRIHHRARAILASEHASASARLLRCSLPMRSSIELCVTSR